MYVGPIRPRSTRVRMIGLRPRHTPPRTQRRAVEAEQMVLSTPGERQQPRPLPDMSVGSFLDRAHTHNPNKAMTVTLQIFLIYKTTKFYVNPNRPHKVLQTIFKQYIHGNGAQKCYRWLLYARLGIRILLNK